MNFWPRGPFIPAVAAALPFAAIQPHFNNPAWDVPQPVVARPFFGPGVAAISPWATHLNSHPLAREVKIEDNNDKPVSPWLHQRNERESSADNRPSSSRREVRNKSRERSRRRYSRSRSRSKSRERPSRDRSDSPRDRRGRDRSRDRQPRRGRDEERRDLRKDRSSSRRRDDSDDDRKQEREEGKDSKRPKSGDDGKYSLEAANYKTQTPNETIMIRGLAQHITENDIRQDIMQCGMRPKDIRLIRKKETGVSRGFAFVEFNTTEEALCWMQLKQGVLMLQDMYRAIMQFSIVVGEPGSAAILPFLADWDCPKCYAHNFKKRITCFKCLSPRPTTDPKHPNSEISPHPTTKIMIRNLDPLATEEHLLKEISAISKTPIQSCLVSRDSLTNLSSGVCYLEMKNVLEAIILYNELTSRTLTILDKKVVVCYCKLQRDPPPAPEWSSDQSQVYSLSDVPKLAEYSARLYATNPSQKASLIQYYTQYYTNQINQISSSEGMPKDINSAAAVALSAMQMAQTKKAVLAGAAASALSAGAALSSQVPASNTPTTSYGYLSSQQLIGNTNIGEPDMATYVYEESSGYYYDQKTGLYYDPKTQYYYHGQDQVYLYWDTEKKAYMPAASATVSSGSKSEEPREDKKVKKEEKEKEKSQDKVKVAKRIAKDMERWAKSQNQKKDIARQCQVAVQNAQSAARSAATADIAFDVLERQEVATYDMHQTSEDEGALVAAYGGGSDSDEAAAADEPNYEQHHTDWAKMACLLCKRQFPSKEALQKHNQLSDLHKQNLATWFSSRGMEQPSGSGGGRSADPSSLSYRDRAKERRLKFGTPDAPKNSKIKEKYVKTQEPVYEEPNRAGIPAANLGSKMMQKMGWSEGMGLGKMNQGRTDIVHAVQRVSTAGLGVAGSTLGSGAPANSYKENVKRAAMARFSEMQEREQS